MGSNGQSWLVASEGEFRIRFWIIAIIFFGGFQLYAWDHVPAASAVAGLLTRAGGNPHAMLTLIYSIGAAMVVAAAALRTWAAAYMSSSVVHDERVRDHRLVADGPYRHLRNPLYLGMILVALGIGLAASRSGFVLIAVAITFFQYRLTRREEAALLATQGEELSPLSRNCAADASQPSAAHPCERGDGAVGTGDSRGTVHVGVCRRLYCLRGDGKYAGADVRLHRGHRDGAVDRHGWVREARRNRWRSELGKKRKSTMNANETSRGRGPRAGAGVDGADRADRIDDAGGAEVAPNTGAGTFFCGALRTWWRWRGPVSAAWRRPVAGVADHDDLCHAVDYRDRAQTDTQNKPRSEKSRALQAIWTAMGCGIFVFAFPVAWSGHFQAQSFMAAIEVMLGIAHVASGSFLRWPLQIVVGALWWAAAIASCFVSENGIAYVFLGRDLCLHASASGST